MKYKLTKINKKIAFLLANVTYAILVLSANSICALPYYEKTRPKELVQLKRQLNNKSTYTTFVTHHKRRCKNKNYY